MRILTLMRHAKSSWDNPHLSDHDRPLNARGEKAALTMAKRLEKRGYVPDLVIVSSALRAQQTAARLQTVYNGALRVKTEPLLYDASPETYVSVIRSVPEDVSHLMIIGHNPTIETLATELGGQPYRMPTAAYICFDIPHIWQRFIRDIYTVLDYDFPKSDR